jgi:ATP-dependent Lon protease
VRSIAVKTPYKVENDFFKKNEIHIHIPEGAVPKDGPSAGVTMSTAILSAVAGIPVRSDVAMTGEVTLRGRVLPIGGLKEKLLAAKTAGVKTVIVPEKNRADVAELDDEIVGGMEIVYAGDMKQVYKTAFSQEN